MGNIIELYKKRDYNIKNKYLKNVIDCCKFHEQKFKYFGLNFDYSVSKRRNGNYNTGFSQSPYSKSVYIHIYNNNFEICDIRISDHKLNSWNILSDNVSSEIFSEDGIIQFNCINIKYCLSFKEDLIKYLK